MDHAPRAVEVISIDPGFRNIGIVWWKKDEEPIGALIDVRITDFSTTIDDDTLLAILKVRQFIRLRAKDPYGTQTILVERQNCSTSAIRCLSYAIYYAFWAEGFNMVWRSPQTRWKRVRQLREGKAGSLDYKERKRISVVVAMEVMDSLKIRRECIFGTKKKKDDLADAFLQAWDYFLSL